ncbi:hypothetical protein P4V41_07100 [Fictibacillus nanhaiensis]|uniref:hypothetical protein n=1 Tax=Fictibacillus nanhaiensis TaxID=742169 RepID=UPI002E1C500B|nr:hypothetical protein [Fictibacillus nanhaiensis]
MNIGDKALLKIKAYSFFIIVGLLLLFFFVKPIYQGIINEYKNDDTITQRDINDFNEWNIKQEEKEELNKSID